MSVVAGAGYERDSSRSNVGVTVEDNDAPGGSGNEEPEQDDTPQPEHRVGFEIRATW